MGWQEMVEIRDGIISLKKFYPVCPICQQEREFDERSGILKKGRCFDCCLESPGEGGE